MQHLVNARYWSKTNTVKIRLSFNERILAARQLLTPHPTELFPRLLCKAFVYHYDDPERHSGKSISEGTNIKTKMRATMKMSQ